MGGVTSPTTPPGVEDRQRVENRYPRRRRAPWVVVIVVLAAVLVGWTVWAGTHHATLPIRASLHGYTVVSDSRVDVTIALHRPDPSVEGSCLLVATDADHVRVGETTVRFAPSDSKDQTVKASVRTFSRAVTAELESCGASR